LVAAIKERALDPKRWTSMGRHLHRAQPPTTWEAVKDAVKELGFPLPPLLGRLWVEVANGGFGPGYGLFGLAGGHVAQGSELTVADGYLMDLDEPGSEVLYEGGWPKKLVRICDWGCWHASAIDCTTSEGEVVDLPESGGLNRKAMTFAQWMEAWVNGEKLWTHSRGW
jgi:hypothetical protein